MVNLVSVEYLKIVGYVVSGYAAARVWLHKEITAGKLLLAHAEVLVKNDAKKIEESADKIEAVVLNEAKKL
jgi:hypothetical protein